MFLNLSAICPCEVNDLNVEIAELEPISAYNFELSVKQVPLEVVANGGGMQTSNLGSLSITTKWRVMHLTRLRNMPRLLVDASPTITNR